MTMRFCQKNLSISILFLIILILLNLSCSKDEAPKNFSFEFGGSSTVVIHNATKSNFSIVGLYSTFLPFNAINTNTCSISPNNKDTLNFNIQSASQDYLLINKVRIPIFLIPYDTLQIVLNSSTKTFPKVSFKGKYASINKYLFTKYEKFGDSLNNKKGDIFNSKSLSLNAYKDSIDKLNNLEIKYLETYDQAKTLPEWFFNYLLAGLKYQTAESKIKIIGYHKTMLNINESVPPNYFNFLKGIQINNPNAKLNLEYYLFLHSYFYEMFVPENVKKMDPRERLNKFVQINLHIADSVLTGEVKDIFKSFIISNFIIDKGELQFADQLIEDQKNGGMHLKVLKFLARMSKKYIHFK